MTLAKVFGVVGLEKKKKAKRKPKSDREQADYYDWTDKTAQKYLHLMRERERWISDYK